MILLLCSLKCFFFFKGFNKFDDTSFVRHSKIPFNVKDNTFEVDKERRKKKKILEIYSLPRNTCLSNMYKF